MAYSYNNQTLQRLRQRLLIEVSLGYIVNSPPPRKEEGQQEIASWVEALGAKSELSPSLIPWSHIVEEENPPRKVVSDHHIQDTPHIQSKIISK